MDPEVKKALDGLEQAAAFARTYRFEMTDDYLAMIEQVEALASNAPGADKSWVWTRLCSAARHYAAARRTR